MDHDLDDQEGAVQQDSPWTAFEALQAEYAERLRSELQAALAHVDEQIQARSKEAERRSRRELATALALAAGRIRKQESVAGIAAALVDAAAESCGRAALLIHREDRLLGFRAAGAVTAEFDAEFQKLTIQATDGAALAGVLEAVEAATVEASPEQLSPAITHLFKLSAEDQVRLYPIALRDKVLAVLYCDSRGESEAVETLDTAIALLVLLAEAWIEAVGTRHKTVAV